MKKFNLDMACKGAPIVTRSGLDARMLCWDVKNTRFPIAVAITQHDGTEMVGQYDMEGLYYRGDERYNLLVKSVKRVCFCFSFVGSDGVRVMGAKIFDSLPLADSHVKALGHGAMVHKIEVED